MPTTRPKEPTTCSGTAIAADLAWFEPLAWARTRVADVTVDCSVLLSCKCESGLKLCF